MTSSAPFASLLVVAALAAGPCAADDSGTASTGRTETVVAEPGAAAPIGIEETAHLPDSRLLARFVRVVEDSRCPVGVTCVWAGRALVELEVSIENSEAPSHLVTLEVGGDPVEVSGAWIAAVALVPAPRVDPPISAEEYRLSLRLVDDDSSPSGESR